MAIAREYLDQHGLIIGVSPERFRAMAMPLLFDHLNAQCEGTIAVNREARIVWMNDKYAEKIGIREPASALGKEVEQVLPASRLREVVQSGQPSMLDLMAFGSEHFVVTRIPLRDEDGTLVGALGFVLFDRARHLKPLMAKYSHLQTQLLATQNELAKARRARYTIAGFIGTSAAAGEIKRQARRAAQLDATVLLRGETGTGKELLAQGIHNLSPRARGPFVAVNVAAIPESLVEAELFGTAPGAFTGADRKARIGKFEVANGGTLFLDEIGDLPLALQAKLLRVLQEQEVEPLGSNQVKPLNVRVIAATHIDLEARVAAGEFRDDLYYRLNVLALRVPPLRERPTDIPALVEHLLDDIANRSGQAPMELSQEALALLCAQPWRGNVRELGNLLERAQLCAEGPQLTATDLLPLLAEPVTEGEPAVAVAAPAAVASSPPPGAPVPPLAMTLAEAERQALQHALQACAGNRRRAAGVLGISRASLYSKLQLHGIGGR
ncbi:sigma-54 interaction domain-containing protein [Stutzerimonas balearica]|jgi:transcriptional regulator with PAS, ATPase and Fis domain|uniref:Fis family transcriptional regulator n=3 Tax=Stutzerimonas balearica TaxID=74829 RepID=A0A8D3XYT0_9GAMM|nr:sigma-54-dependent Fis family transcriptional regulator [Stutzerimonas balearica]MBB60378.1 sigma-54-dependent Fis family transcriptional regulator [Pseudomonas sp.]AJE14211.1 Fis family transcriptional regulator [Stutzerimonas balearica DSM 6083]MBC7200263.1 sigma-54-dependent Fis family transcriptional regulator [Stutzerimonas balearica]MBD3734993.1 sigma-54-dependent Fis family transcriptional regulator [Stutzerimonas balearica]MCZ4126389.1 sigma-54-dependent Fis family transcriptional r